MGCLWNVTALFGRFGYRLDPDKHVCRMYNWQTRLSDLQGLSHHDKLFLENTLLAWGDDDRAAQFFPPNEIDEEIVMRLGALLPNDGETGRKLTVIYAQTAFTQQ